MYHHTKNEVSMSTASKVIARTDTQTHRHDENITSTAYAGNNEDKIMVFRPDFFDLLDYVTRRSEKL